MCTDARVPSIRTYAALRADGSSRRAIARATASGMLLHIRRGVYAAAGTCPRAVAAAAHGGALACASAARHRGLWVLDDSAVHVWLNRGGHRRPHAPCACIEHWDEGASSHAFALPPIVRILWQLLRCQGVEAMFVSLESALRLGMLSRAELRTLRAAVPRSVREVIDDARADADSGLESLLRFRLRGHGLAVRTQVAVFGVGRVDFLIGDRLIVEVDGKPGHLDAPSRHKDLVRDANAAAWDLETLRFDYALIMHDWDLVERAILARVAARRHIR